MELFGKALFFEKPGGFHSVQFFIGTTLLAIIASKKIENFQQNELSKVLFPDT
jgi:hypothetical protein